MRSRLLKHASPLLLGPALLCGCLFPEYTFDQNGGGGIAGSGGVAGGGGAPSGGGGAGGVGGLAGMGGMGGMGGMPPTEDCFVAGDEDDDSLSDCEDPDCTADLECVPAIPVGWGTFGLVALYAGSANNDPDCPEGTSSQVHTGNGDLINTSSTCSNCSCGSPSWAACELDDFNAGASGLQGARTKNTACGMAATAPQAELNIPLSWDGSCTALNTAPGGATCAGNACNTAVEAATARPVNGTCVAGGGEQMGGTPTFTSARKACRADALSGCEGTEKCVPRWPAPFEARACVAKVGDQACPVGYPQKTISYVGISDDRECSECSCGVATGGSCKLEISLFSDGGCATPLPTDNTVDSGQCQNLTGNPTVAGRSAIVTQAPAGGNCAVTSGGAVPSGAAVPSDPTTFCCLVE